MSLPVFPEDIFANSEFESFDEFYAEFININFTSTLNDSDYIDDLLDNFGSYKDSNFLKFTDYLNVYVLPIVASIGLTGNIVSFTVFMCTYMRRQSSSIYLAALSVADMMFLLCILLSKHTGGINLYDKDGWCQILTYITYISSFLSVWFVVSFTCERYIVIMFPLRRTRLCTTRRAKIVVGVLTCTAVVLYSFGPWTSGVVDIMGQRTCAPLDRYLIVVDVFYNIDTIVTLIVPFFAIMVMNLRITVKVVQFYRVKKSMPLKQEKGGSGSGDSSTLTTTCTTSDACANASKQQLIIKYSGVRQMNITSRTRTTYTRTQVRVTKMLLTVSTIFLVLNLPRHTTRTYSFIMRLLDEHYVQSPNAILWDRIFMFLYHTNFSVNLFLYSVLNISFRKAFVWLLKRIQHAVREFFVRNSYICTVEDDDFAREFNRKTKQFRSNRAGIPMRNVTYQPGAGKLVRIH